MGDDEPLRKADRDKLERMADAFERIDAAVFALGLQGLQRATATSAVELQALQQTAHNAALIAVERHLEVLATHIRRYVERDPLFTMADYAATLNRVWLLNQRARRLHAEGAAPDAMVDVIGEARRGYAEVERPLVVQALGASGWVTDTEFVGVTVYFYVSESPDTIYQASNAKPTMYFGTDPRRLLHEPISEHLTRSIYEMAHGAFELVGARVSRDGRLSLHKDLAVNAAPYLGARAYERLAARDWIELVDRFRARELHPVEGAGASLAFVEPAGWGELKADEKAARVTLPLLDGRGSAMTLEVPMREENNFLIDNLEWMTGRKRGAAGLRPDALFGRAWIAEGALKFFPYTAVYNRAVVAAERTRRRVNEVHLALESLRNVKVSEA